MKKVSVLFVLPILFIGLTSFLSPTKSDKKENKKVEKIEKIINRYKPAFEALNYDMDAFLKLTPSAYKEITGKKLSLRESIELRQVQKGLKSTMSNFDNEDTMPQWAYIVLVILGLGFIPIGVLTDWKGNDWWLNLLLTLCFWIPGVVHGLIIMKKFY